MSFMESQSTSFVEEEGVEGRPVPDLGKNNPQRVYLVTYSQADLSLFPTRHSFGSAVTRAFGGNAVAYFCCSKEDHIQTSGSHYHCAIKLTKTMRWLKAKQYLTDTHGIVVNFKECPEGGMYSRAYKYVTKSDRSPYLGSILETHPTHASLQATTHSHLANDSFRGKRKSSVGAAAAADSKKTKPRRLDRLDLVEAIRERDMKTEDQLLLFAEDRRIAGERDFSRMILNLGEKGRRDIIRDAWKMAASAANVVSFEKTRLDILREIGSNQSNCICGGGKWLVLACDLLEKNNLDLKKVCSQFYNAIKYGRSKHNNVMIVGESNCGKTFLLEPLNEIFKTFNTPASSMFGWLNVESCRVIYLNDFRWVNPLVHNKGGIIMWDALLRLLEGRDCKLPAPMNSCAEHIELLPQHDLPVFCTSIDVIRYYIRSPDEPQTPVHEKENKMMAVRWIDPVIRFTHVFEEEDEISCVPCGYCFARFVLYGEPK